MSDPTPIYETTALRPYQPGADGSQSLGLLAVSHDGHLVASPSPDRATADGYLRLTARVLLEAEKHGFKTIGVLSALDGEGKTTAAVNLAVCLGRAHGRQGRVLLVDGDARKRTLSKMFCGDAGGSLHPMLVGTSFEGVDVMTAPNGADRLSISAPSAWIATFAELASRYPLIVIDCPPVIEDPEGLVLRECVEGLVLVVRAGSTPRRLVERAIGKVGGRVLGVVLNGLEGTGSSDQDLWR